MGFSRLEKINALTALDINEGNVTETAKQFGVSRLTIYNWQKQLESDVRLLAQVQAAKENLANIEELTALKALAEINKRLDMTPEKEKTQDLIKVKDSGINNSRLIRGQATVITESIDTKAEMLRDFLKAKFPERTDNELAELMIEGDWGVSLESRRRVAERMLTTQ